jgi:DNA-binding transcriptional MerR regulator
MLGRPMGITVKQVAERVGLPSRTVRYYDRIGLVSANDRSDAGYRLYSPADEGRLRFIRQAKLLGLSLDEIRGLMDAAEGGGCGSTLPELERLIERKVEQIDDRIAELKAFRDRLAAYADAKRPSPSHTCGHGRFCGCLDDIPEP